MYADGSFSCIVRRGPEKPDYRVRVTPSYAMECPCRHYEELMRSCRQGIAAIKVALSMVGLAQYQNVMDHRWLGTVWHLETWCAQHAGVIKRVLWPAMRRSSCNQISLRRGCTPGRAASGKSRISRRSRIRECAPLRHVGPLHGQLFEAQHRPTVPETATENN